MSGGTDQLQAALHGSSETQDGAAFMKSGRSRLLPAALSQLVAVSAVAVPSLTDAAETTDSVSPFLFGSGGTVVLQIAALVVAAGVVIALGWLRLRDRRRARESVVLLEDQLDRQVQQFASLTEAYNDLVIDLTRHTRQRQLERRRFFTDIEKQKSDLISARDAALSEAMTRSRFFAGMTHELRTPMNAIMGFSEAIEKQIFGPDQMDRYSDYAHDIRISAQHLLDTINNLLDMAKAESGKLELDDEAIDVGTVLSDCAAMLRRMAENAGVRLVVHVAAEVAPYSADRRILRQIVINLLSNAIKFTGEGGEVVIEARADAADDLLITVADNGRGIAGEDLAGLFEPFVQGRIKGSQPGTGLGLPLSRTFARLHGGELVLSSEEGVGTVASLYLPSWRWRRPVGTQEMVPPSNSEMDTAPEIDDRVQSTG